MNQQLNFSFLHLNLTNVRYVEMIQWRTEIPISFGQNRRIFMKFSQQWALSRVCLANHSFNSFHFGFGFFGQIHREFSRTIPCAWHKAHNHEQTCVNKTQNRIVCCKTDPKKLWQKQCSDRSMIGFAFVKNFGTSHC